MIMANTRTSTKSAKSAKTKTTKAKATAAGSKTAKTRSSKTKAAGTKTTAAKSRAKTKAATKTKAKPRTTAKAKPKTTAKSRAKTTAAKRKESPEVNVDRRVGKKDRRFKNEPVAVERRAKVQRRRQIDPTTCERDYTADEVEFMGALSEYKRTSGRMFPTCSEILEVIRKLGYQKLPEGQSQLLQVGETPDEVRAETTGPITAEMPLDQIPQPTAI